MWTHVARYAVRSGSVEDHLGELVGVLGLRVEPGVDQSRALLHAKLARAVSYRCKESEKRGIVPTVQGFAAEGGKVWQYPAWVRRWAEPGWNGDIRPPSPLSSQALKTSEELNIAPPSLPLPPHWPCQEPTTPFPNNAVRHCASRIVIIIPGPPACSFPLSTWSCQVRQTLLSGPRRHGSRKQFLAAAWPIGARTGAERHSANSLLLLNHLHWGQFLGDSHPLQAHPYPLSSRGYQARAEASPAHAPRSQRPNNPQHR